MEEVNSRVSKVTQPIWRLYGNCVSPSSVIAKKTHRNLMFAESSAKGGILSIDAIYRDMLTMTASVIDPASLVELPF